MLEGRDHLTGKAHTATDRERRRRQRAKARAGRMYERQFAAEAASAGSAVEDGAPRAALYKGKMGASQRRSARMQRSSSAGPVSAKINPAGWFSNLDITPRTLKIATAVLCFVLVCAFLYMPARQYYQAQRENQRLTVEYSVIEERNEAIDLQNDTLASDAGMEDAVRQKYGYVVQGDQTAIVTGLSSAEGERRAANNDDLEANVLSSTVKAPEEWYTPFLDAFFGVE